MQSGDRMKIVIAQCTDEKRSGRHMAKDLYMTSDLFKAQRRYAEAYADQWYILSAKYGLVHPLTRLTSYDMDISERDDDLHGQGESTIRGWGDNVDVEIIAGGDYLKRLEWYLEEYDIDYTVPFDGQRYGERIKSMKREARKVENKQIGQYASG